MCIISVSYWPTITKFASQVHLMRLHRQIHYWFDLLVGLKGQNVTSSSPMAERPRELGHFKRLGHCEAKFYFEGLRFVPISMDR